MRRQQITLAHELGCEIVKVFPGGLVGGPAFVKAVRGPCPWALLMPTGGVDGTPESIRAWIEAGAACIGMGSKLIPKNHIAAADYGAIQQNVRRVLDLIQDARGDQED